MLVLYVRCAVAQALLGPRQLPAEVRRVVQLGHLKGGTIHNAQCSPAVFKRKGTDRVIASANYGHEPCEPPQIVYMCVNMEPSPCLRAHEGAKTLEKVGFLPPFFNSPQPFCSRD